VPEEEWTPSGVDDLEPAAWDALRRHGSSAVTAGPGAGKTEFLAQRATYLLQTGLCPAPTRILAISYKRDSASTLARRVAARAPEHAGRFVSMTFDSFTKGLLDRFLDNLPADWRMPDGYTIDYPTARQVAGFLNDTALSMRPAGYVISGLPPQKFLSTEVGVRQLPSERSPAPDDERSHATWAWWEQTFFSQQRPALEFNMINRLAELIMRSNSRLLRALRATYPFVFIDEFQDTTGAQFSLLQTLFQHSGTQLTAVGDRNQRIMDFAGAVEDAIPLFQRTFDAELFELRRNYRSSEPLVAMQQRVAARLQPVTVQIESRAKQETGHVPVSVWTYRGDAAQADGLAQWISDDIATGQRRPGDFAILVRQKVADVEPALRRAFQVRDIRIVNVDARFGVLSLQDLQKHDILRLFQSLLLLATHRSGQIGAWTASATLLDRVSSTGDDDSASRRTSDRLTKFVRGLRGWLDTNDIADTDPTELVRRVLSVVDEADLAAFVRGQHSGEQLPLVLESLTSWLADLLHESSDWAALVHAMDLTDAVTLMTIHRSKGLEYHTVVLLGLDDNQWWSYSKNAAEATSAFYVALSRAAQRLIVTCAVSGADAGALRDLYLLLDASGAERRHFK
jgi:DNA helicase-2/ATP-dependent DNA helicase PcrA